MAKIDLSLRDRHAIKWHLNGVTIKDRNDSRKLDQVWVALKLDDVTTKPTVDPDTIDITPVTFDMTSTERGDLIDWLNTPRLGAMSRLLSQIDARLIKSRDGEAA